MTARIDDGGNPKKTLIAPYSSFTLIEMLVSLLIISLIMHGLLSFLLVSRSLYQREEEDRAVAFSQLILILEEELKILSLKEIGRDYLKVTDGQSSYKIILQNNKIYKTPGHHPYAYQVKEWQVFQHEHHLEIIVTYTNEQTFYGWVYYEK